MGVNKTPCNWEVLFAPNAGVSLVFDKESKGFYEILSTDCEEFNRSGVSKSTSSDIYVRRIGVPIQFVYYFPIINSRMDSIIKKFFGDIFKDFSNSLYILSARLLFFLIRNIYPRILLSIYR